VVSRSAGRSLDEALQLEAGAAGPLISSSVSKNLIHVFHLREEARQEPPTSKGMPAGALDRLGLWNLGRLGSAVAQLAASRGVRIQIWNEHPADTQRALRRARGLFNRAVAMGRMEPWVAADGMRKISAVRHPEDLRLCRTALVDGRSPGPRWKKVMKTAEKLLDPDVVLISVRSPGPGPPAQPVLARPQRRCGIHFLGREARASVVELVPGPETSPDTLAVARRLASLLGKTPLVVADAPGFLVTRTLEAARGEASEVLRDGSRLQDLEGACRSFGLAPEVFRLRQLPGPRRGSRGAVGTGDIQLRLVLSMLNQAATILEEGVVSRAADVDLGLVAAGGFPAFRGGLLRYADLLGGDRLLSDFQEMHDRWGERFKPSSSVVEITESGRAFYEVFP
jgi:3-hydroxyacyl-CoA dehydrogenase/enoyl-CoA hydratase/3-hydroxybutyryl-CoA epimerase